MPQDITQIFLVITLSVTSIVLAFVGYQIFQVFKELRIGLQKVNEIIGSFERLSDSVESGFKEVAGFASGFRSVFKILEIIKSRKGEQQPTSQ